MKAPKLNRGRSFVCEMSNGIDDAASQGLHQGQHTTTTHTNHRFGYRYILDEKHTHDSTNAYNHLSTHTLADDDKNYSSENHRVVVVVVRVVMAADPDIIYNPPNGQNGELPQGFFFPSLVTHNTAHNTVWNRHTCEIQQAEQQPN